MKGAHLIECGWTNLTVMVKLKLTGKGSGFFFSPSSLNLNATKVDLKI